MNTLAFDFKNFLKDSIDVLVNPKFYFSTLKSSGGIIEPLIKAVIYGAVAGIIALLLSLLHIVTDSKGLVGAAYGLKMFVTYFIISVPVLFIGTGLLIALSYICKGITQFGLSIRIVASVLVILPIRALLGFAVGMNFYLSLLVILLTGVIALWLIYNSLLTSLSAKPDLVKIILPVLIIVFVLLLSLYGYEVWNKANQFKKALNNFNFKEIKIELPKN